MFHPTPSHTRSIKQLAPIVLLAGVVLFGSSHASESVTPATASSSVSSSVLAQMDANPNQTVSSPAATTADELPPSVADRVLQDLSERTGIPQDSLTILRTSPETWQDSCLGLGSPVEICAQATVPGWQIQVGTGEQTWFYHTDATGSVIRLSDRANNLPPSVSDRVLQAASQQSGLPISALSITAADPQIWDGCLGITPPDGLCTEIGIFGWRAVVSNGAQTWVYHTNQDGTDIRLNEAVSAQSGSSPAIVVGSIPEATPFYVGKEVVFQATMSGGIVGQTEQIMLLANGDVVRLAPEDLNSSAPIVVQRLSQPQIQQFTALLDQHRFSEQNGLSYAPSGGAADYITITLMSRNGTTRYADMVQDQLPPSLQAIIQAWSQITRSPSGS